MEFFSGIFIYTVQIPTRGRNQFVKQCFVCVERPIQMIWSNQFVKQCFVCVEGPIQRIWSNQFVKQCFRLC